MFIQEVHKGLFVAVGDRNIRFTVNYTITLDYFYLLRLNDKGAVNTDKTAFGQHFLQCLQTR